MSQAEILKEGMSGPAVRALQQALINAGVRSEAPSGDYDEATTREVREFQHKNGITEDGIVGVETLARLGEYLEVLLSEVAADQKPGMSQARPGLPWTGLSVKKAKQYF